MHGKLLNIGINSNISTRDSNKTPLKRSSESNLLSDLTYDKWIRFHMILSYKFTEWICLNVHAYDILISCNSEDLERHIRFHNRTGDAVRIDVGHLALNSFTNLFVHNKWEYNVQLSLWVWDDSVTVVTAIKFCACKMAYLHQMTIREQLLLRRHVFRHVRIQTPF